MKADLDLLSDYVETGAEHAFAELVRRHAGAVRAAALRQTCNPDTADEVTQAVFIRLAQQASRIKPGCVLLGWLLRTARYAAIDSVRASVRRQKWEANMQSTSPDTHAGAEPPHEEAWDSIAPHLDAVLDGLREADRNALVLRYFEEKSLADVGVALGIKEEAARKRVDRALAKLADALRQRGIVAPAAQMAPALLGMAIAKPSGEFVSQAVRMALGGRGAASPAVAALVRELALRSLKWRLAAWFGFAAALVVIGSASAAVLRRPPAAFEAGTTGDYRAAGFPDPLPVNRFVAALQTDLRRGDRKSAALKMHYPLRVNGPAGAGSVISAVEFTNRYDELFSPAAVALLLKSPRESLQADQRGVYLEAGALWIGPETGGPNPEPRVIAINSQ